MNTIELFMWAYQTSFQIEAKVAAQNLFNKLAEDLAPRVFLVGLLENVRTDRHPICLEPDNSGYEPQTFATVRERAKHWQANDAEMQMVNSDPTIQANRMRRAGVKGLQSAIKEAVRVDDEERGLVSFCSWPVLVGDYLVAVVLQFDRPAFDSHYTLVRDSRLGVTVPVSLLDATIGEYLDACADALNKPSPGAGIALLERDNDELIRAAGKHLMYTPALATNELDGLHGLFEACNVVSSMRYEGTEGRGRLIVAPKAHSNVAVTVGLSRPVSLREYRAVRKLLEMSSDTTSLLSDSHHIYGLGRIVWNYDQRREDLFVIQFTKHYTWELWHGDQLMMRTTYGLPELPKTRVDQQKFKTDLKRIFAGITAEQVEQLWDVVLEATNQKHGTMVVVSAGASTEAQRLANQATVINQLALTPQLLGVLTAIDGAVLIDQTATCHAIGVILDGVASDKGTPARGARYNSAIRYVETSKYACLAIVVSEDGSIDLVPNLMPQISKAVIEESIEVLRSLATESSFDFRKFNETMSWLTRHRFYLLPETCEEINGLKHQLEVIRDRVTEPRILRPLFADFVPNEEMNESYFVENIAR